MNFDRKTFDEIVQAATCAMGERFRPPDIQDPRKVYAKEFTDNLLISLFHCTRSEYLTPQRVLEISFTGGFFCQMLDALSERNDIEKMNFILSVLNDNVFTMEGKMGGILLNCNAESIKSKYDELKNRATRGCTYLTYQSVLDMPVKEFYAMCFAMFLVGCSVSINYNLR